MNRRARRRRGLPSSGRHPITGERVHDMDSAQLRRRLVEDALGGRAAPIEWEINAFARIAALDGIGHDAAYLSVREEVAALGGVMPGAPGK